MSHPDVDLRTARDVFGKHAKLIFNKETYYPSIDEKTASRSGIPECDRVLFNKLTKRIIDDPDCDITKAELAVFMSVRKTFPEIGVEIDYIVKTNKYRKPILGGIIGTLITAVGVLAFINR